MNCFLSYFFKLVLFFTFVFLLLFNTAALAVSKGAILFIYLFSRCVSCRLFIFVFLHN
jgi:hypothetical protein